MKIRFLKKLTIIVMAFVFAFTAIPITSTAYARPAKNAVKTSSKKKTSAKKTKSHKKKKPSTPIVALSQPSAVSGESITFADHFTSDSENKLTMRWDPVTDAGGYEVNGIKTGTTDDESVITRIDNAKEKVLYYGNSNIAVFTIARNTMYTFKVRSVNKSGKQKKVSEWTEINYFPSTDDSSERTYKATDAFISQMGADALANIIRHGNVIALANNFKM